LYSRIPPGQNDRLDGEYGSYVRPQFIRYLAENHADELAALGICPQGIDRMKKGFDPVDPSGRLYNVNVDHIIERFGSGKASVTKEVDPLMPPGSRPTHLVNHFNNFILLPMAVHNLKNALNNIQSAANAQRGQGKWVLMIVPQAGPGHSGYVSQPQGQLSTVQPKLGTHRMSAWQLAASTAEQLSNILEGIGQNPEQKQKQDELLKPALEEMSKTLMAAFSDASRPRQNIKPFLGFYQGERFLSLRQKVEALPPDGTAKLREVMQSIDDGITARFNPQAVRKTPANNNERTPKAPKVVKQVVENPPHVSHRHKRKKNKRHGR